ncbi:hypothetical protein FQA39_LY04898 [Lamprigera yunnana]|nr:hypothetical protein FQA39_LY04898 [Lamprigera yunnana]
MSHLRYNILVLQLSGPLLFLYAFDKVYSTTELLMNREVNEQDVIESGLIIDKGLSFMCSPDGLIGDYRVVEIKTSVKSGKLAPIDAVVQGFLCSRDG